MSSWYTGSPLVLTLTVDPFGLDTSASVRVLDPDGQESTPPAAFIGDQGTWQATVPAATMPGDWWGLWTVTGTGAGVAPPQRVPVGPMPDDLAGLRVYATTADLARFLRKAPPEDAGRLLARASELVELATMRALYDTDDDGMPTTPEIVTAFRLATCAVVPHWKATGDELAAGWQSVSIGSVAMSRPGGAGTPEEAQQRMGAQARTFLHLAGLLSGPVQTHGYC